MMNMLAVTTTTARLFAAQKGLCFHCSAPMLKSTVRSGKAFSREHILPRSGGGGNGRNIVLAHRNCNTKRGNTPPTAEMIAKAEAIWGMVDKIAYVTPDLGR